MSGNNDEALMTNDEIMTKSERKNDESEETFWDNGNAPIIREEPSDKRVYDLEERTARFGEAVVDFARTIPQDAVTNRIINQLVGAGTSVGANYVEADDAVSKKEFLKSIGTCKKEVRKAKHFLRMAVRAVPELKPEACKLWLEARELHLIFSKIWRSGKMNDEIPTTNNQEMTFVLRALSFFRHSSFVIRHFEHAC
jgi:four helix bundle protein